jgi:hypothetical protein
MHRNLRRQLSGCSTKQERESLILKRGEAMNQLEPSLLAKLQQLPPQRLAEVEDFIDFLRSREDDRAFAHAAARAAEPAFAKVWDNDEDAAYDRL